MYSIFLCIKHYPKKRKYFINKQTPVKGRGGNSIGQKKMLNCSAHPTEPWPAHCGALRQYCPFMSGLYPAALLSH